MNIRLRNRPARLAAGVVVMLCLTVGSAQALPFFVQARGSASGGCLNANVCGNTVYHHEFQDTGVLLNETSTSISVGGSGNGAASSVQGIAELGALRAFALASSSAPETLAEGTVNLQWSDTFTVGSNFIPAPGEALAFTAKLELGVGALESALARGAVSRAGVQAAVSITGGGQHVVLETGDCSEGGSPCPNHIQQLIDVAALNLQPFQNYSVVGLLDMGVDAEVFNVAATSIAALADVLHTAVFHLDPVTEGATYITASGVTYRTTPISVPEPATLYLLSAAFAGVLVWGTRARERLGRSHTT